MRRRAEPPLQPLCARASCATMELDVAFEGGGAKGAVFVGALAEFERRGHFARRFVGTSAGAMTAVLVAAGYNSQELLLAMDETLPDGSSVFATFRDVPETFSEDEIRGSLFAQLLDKIDLPFIPSRLEARFDKALLDKLLTLAQFRQWFSLLERGGMYEGESFLRWLEGKLDATGKNLSKATLAEFAAKTGTDVSVIAADITEERMLVLNHRTAPNVPVAWAVRMSMSLPFIWQEVLWKREWGTFMDRDITGHRIVDGGVLSNFPLDLLTSSMSEVVKIMGDTDPDAVPNVGFLIDESLPVVDESAETNSSHRDGVMDLITHSKAAARLERLLETMLNAHDRAVIERCMNREEVCRLPAKGYSATEFTMAKPRLQALVEAGRRAASAYFDERERLAAARAKQAE